MSKFLVAILLLFFAGSAFADTCGGKLIGYSRIYSNGLTIGQLQLYYNAANGNNCAVLKHASPTWGVSLRTKVDLFTCTDSTCARPANPRDIDTGYYRYEAGPVRIYGKGRCVAAVGTMDYRGVQAGTGIRSCD